MSRQPGGLAHPCRLARVGLVVGVGLVAWLGLPAGAGAEAGAAPTAAAGEPLPLVLQVGGGDWIGDAQGQIEANVVWLSRLLPRLSDRVVTYYGAGTSGQQDVAVWDPGLADAPLTPLARVLEGPKAGFLVTRANRVPDLAGGTRKEDLMPALRAQFAGLAPGGSALLIYNGHGGEVWGDPGHNYLRLWERGRLTVGDLDALFDQAPITATIRFVLPQCYSGAFKDLIYDHPGSTTPAAQTRCGVFAQSAFAESEGCALSVEADRFRDYTTYLFAPLAGRTREGAPLPADPDRNGDGAVSYREAHHYALVQADSKDIPRSTAEAFLLDWRPWFLRWSTLGEARDSLYWALAEDLARRVGIDPTLSGSTLRAARAARAAQVQALSEDLAALNARLETERQILTEALRSRWPAVFHPYTDGYRRLLAEDLPAITGFLARQTAYAGLVTVQDRILRLEDARLEAERALAQVEKIRHLKDLARLEGALRRFGSRRHQATYARLLACEEAAMGPAPGAGVRFPAADAMEEDPRAAVDGNAQF